MMLLFALYFMFLTNVDGIFYKTNFTDFKQCRVYYSRYGSLYKDFFHISDQNQSSVDNETLFDFHFSVLALRDAHILLSPLSTVTLKDSVYEIVIGAGGNSFSDIRRKQKSSVRASIRRNDLLSGVDERSFWIHIYKDGTISVGIEGEELPFISWVDPDPLPLQYFSFATFGDTEAKWYFNCPRENTTIQEIEPLLTDVVKLRQHLLTDYNPFVRPVYDASKASLVNFKLSSNLITLDEIKSVMNVKGTVEMEWFDEKLLWNSENYSNLESLHVHHGEVWRPDIVVLNSRDNMDVFQGSLITVSYTGKVRWSPAMDAFTFCDMSELSHWPEDVHKCELHLVPRKTNENVQINYSNQSNLFAQSIISGWKIIDVKIDQKQNNLTITFHLQRISDLYKRALFTQYWVIATMGLLTFCASPIGSAKIALCCAQLILTVATLITMALLLPGHPNSLPFLVFLYSKSMFDNGICVLVAVIVINLARNEKTRNPPHYITAILNSCLLEWLFLLPKLEEQVTYNKVDKRLERETAVQETWIKLSNLVDRLFFVGFLCAHFAVFFMKY